jgi:isoleucyl-tRNA synthetase
MHKSLGNVILPHDVVKKYGAEIVRWWALATDWRSDVRVSDEILERTADAYRKVRNTFRFLLGNLGDFDPAQALPRERLTAVDRAFSDALTARLAVVREAWQALQFHRALDAVLGLCTVDLSAVFLDVSKDRLYTLATDDPARRSAQTVLWQALHDLTIAISPALVFTADEVWQHHPALLAECESVHLARWPERPAGAAGPASDDEWEFLHGVRDAVNAAIEPLRAAKTLASTAAAEVTIAGSEPVIARLRAFGAELAALLIVAKVELVASGPTGELSVTVQPTTLVKCERCWMHREDVVAEGTRAGLCARCVTALESAGR